MTTERDDLEPVRELLRFVAGKPHQVDVDVDKGPRFYLTADEASAALAALEPAREPPPEDMEMLRGRAMDLATEVYGPFATVVTNGEGHRCIYAGGNGDALKFWCTTRDEPTALRALIAALEALAKEARRAP